MTESLIERIEALKIRAWSDPYYVQADGMRVRVVPAIDLLEVENLMLESILTNLGSAALNIIARLLPLVADHPHPVLPNSISTVSPHDFVAGTK